MATTRPNTLKVAGPLFWLALACELLALQRAAAQAPDAQPSPVAIAFDATAAQLPQTEIAAAVRAELAGVSDLPAGGQLAIAVQGDKLVLGYTPGARTIERTTELPRHTADLPAIVALLAGNLVRDDAAALLSAPAEVAAPAAPLAPAPPATSVQPVPAPASEPEPSARERDWPRLRLSLLGQLLVGGSMNGLAGGTPEFGGGGAVRAELPIGRFLGAALMLGTTTFRIGTSEAAHAPGSGGFTDLAALFKLGLPLRESPIELALYFGPGIALGGEVTARGVERRDGRGADAIVFDLDVGYSLSAYASALWWLSDRWGAFVEASIGWRHAVMKKQTPCFSATPEECAQRDDPEHVLAFSGGAPLYPVWVVQTALHLGVSHRFP